VKYEKINHNLLSYQKENIKPSKSNDKACIKKGFFSGERWY